MNHPSCCPTLPRSWRKLRGGLFLADILIVQDQEPAPPFPGLGSGGRNNDTISHTSTNFSSLSPSPSNTPVKEEAVPSAQGSDDPLAHLPPLATSLATTEDEQVETLRLIADSVAQQQQVTAKHLIFHPIVVGLTALLIGAVSNFLYTRSPGDLAVIATTAAGCIMTILVTVQWVTEGYIEHAERVRTWVWPAQDSDNNNNNNNKKKKKKRQEILITKYGGEIIDALVLRIEKDTTSLSLPSTSSAHNTCTSKHKQFTASSRTGIIRAWTLKHCYRQKGIGTGLLEEAVSLCRTRQLNDPVFSNQHANSKRILPALFDSVFDQREQWAWSLLDKVITESGGGLAIINDSLT